MHLQLFALYEAEFWISISASACVRKVKEEQCRGGRQGDISSSGSTIEWVHMEVYVLQRQQCSPELPNEFVALLFDVSAVRPLYVHLHDHLRGQDSEADSSDGVDCHCVVATLICIDDIKRVDTHTQTQTHSTRHQSAYPDRWHTFAANFQVWSPTACIVCHFVLHASPVSKQNQVTCVMMSTADLHVLTRLDQTRLD